MDVLFFWLYILEMKIVIKVVQTKGDTACKVVCNSMDNPYSGLPIGSLCGTGSWHWSCSSNFPSVTSVWCPQSHPGPLSWLLQAQSVMKFRETGGGWKSGILLLVCCKQSAMNTMFCTQTAKMGHQCHEWCDKPLGWWAGFVWTYKQKRQEWSFCRDRK